MSLTQVKKEKIKDMFYLLQKGETIIVHGYASYNGYTFKSDCTLYKNFFKPYIHYKRFGSSAVQNTLKDLTWLVNTICECKGKDFTYSIA